MMAAGIIIIVNQPEHNVPKPIKCGGAVAPLLTTAITRGLKQRIMNSISCLLDIPMDYTQFWDRIE